jgi:hypothetical protein
MDWSSFAWGALVSFSFWAFVDALFSGQETTSKDKPGGQFRWDNPEIFPNMPAGDDGEDQDEDGDDGQADLEQRYIRLKAAAGRLRAAVDTDDEVVLAEAKAEVDAALKET